jgi:uncharacterized protein (UPF0548 family)
MFLLLKPDNKSIREFLDRQADDNFSYSEIGASLTEKPSGYNFDHNRILIGSGEQDFLKAVSAVRNWKMFDFPWIEIHPANAPIEAGENVAILISHFGFWSLNASRIVYVLEEKGEIEKFGFAYGTLSEHEERGEERFSVEFDRESGEVWYDLFAFSKPNHLLAKLGYPLSRSLQKKFAEASKKAMRNAVK